MQSFLPVVPLIDTEGPTHGRDDMFATWESLERAIQELTGKTRDSLKDSFGNPLVISWFILDWSRYSKFDPEFIRRGHEHDLHSVWNFYTKDILSPKNVERTKDGLYWHYHHPPKDGSFGWNKNWNDSFCYEYILGKLILDVKFFSPVYRAGKYIETNDSSAYLERFIPFDYSSISPIQREFCDWSKAPVSFVPYHPDTSNYERPGNMRRLIARSLPVAAKGGSGSLDIREVERAFMEFKEGKSAIFSFHSHDYYKSINDEFKHAHQLIQSVSEKMGIPWKYMNALDALRLTLPKLPPLVLTLKKVEEDRFKITANHELIGPTPFVAIEDVQGNVHRGEVVTESDGSWIVHAPAFIRRFGVAGADLYGNTDVVTFTYEPLQN